MRLHVAHQTITRTVAEKINIIATQPLVTQVIVPTLMELLRSGQMMGPPSSALFHSQDPTHSEWGVHVCMAWMEALHLNPFPSDSTY